MRKTYVRQILWISLASLLTFCAQGSAAEPRTNFLLITVDDMNCDSIGAFGSKVKGITPNIDRLASQGMSFDRAHVTIAICQPTRAVWMTGRYPHRSGALGFDPIRPGVPTLLESLKKAGYYTGILAKVPHVVPTRKAAWDSIVEARTLRTGRDPKLFADHTRRMLAEAKASKRPFFIMANSQDPHRPFAGSRQENQRKAKAKRPNARKKDQGGFPDASRVFTPDEIPVPGFLPDIPDIRRELAQYYTSVHRADAIAGAVLAELDKAGVTKNTLVMFLSDHGMPLPFAKTNCWYHSTRTPWIVSWPGVISANSRDRNHMISGIDLAPTVLDALELPALDGSDGRSFLPVLKGESQANRDRVFTHINRTAGKKQFPMRAVLTKQHIYIFNAWSDGETIFKNESQNGLTMKAMIEAAKTNETIAARVDLFLKRVPEELYDYAADPDARHNLVKDPAHAETLKRLRSSLRQQLESSDDPQHKAFLGLLEK